MRTIVCLLTFIGLLLLGSSCVFAQAYVFNVAGSSQGLQNGNASTARFNFPSSVIADSKGNLFVADYTNHLVRKIDTRGYVTTFAGTGLPGKANGTGTAASFNFPFAIAIDGKDTLYVSDVKNHLIRKISPTAVVTTFAGSTVGYKDATDTLAQFNNPAGIALDHAGNVFVADQFNQRIRKISQGQVTTLAGSTQGFKDGTGSSAQFSSPSGITSDGIGNLYVADLTNNRIRKITPSGVVTTLAGNTASGFVDGNGSAALFNAPQGVTTDNKGNLYIADTYNNAIRWMDTSGNVKTLAGGTQGSNNGYRNKAQFNTPYLLYCDKFGDIYIADAGNNRIRRLEGGQVTPGLTNFLEGRVFIDANHNGLLDSTETLMRNLVLEVNPGSFFTSTDTFGRYSFQLDTGINYTVKEWIPPYLQGIVSVSNSQKNPKIIRFSLLYQDSLNFDIADTAHVCAVPRVELSTLRRRMCELSSTIISYSNEGIAPLLNASITIVYPPSIIPLYSSPRWSGQKDSALTFYLDTLPAMSSGQIVITDSVLCLTNNYLYNTVCMNAWITGNNTCVDTSSLWDRSYVQVSGYCNQSKDVVFTISNAGKGNMSDSLPYRLFINDYLKEERSFKLLAGQSVTFYKPANGQTYRLEADQAHYFPTLSAPNVTVEGCLSPDSVNATVSKGFYNAFNNDDPAFDVAISCSQLVNSEDPNSKDGQPVGVSNKKYILPGSSITYSIHFQNTGTDTAYTVRVTDTLDAHLDVSGFYFYPGNYSGKVTGSNHVSVVEYTIRNANLPDSTTDKLHSMGLVRNIVPTYDTCKNGTPIYNKAYIYFDYNNLIVTNTTLHTVWDTLLTNPPPTLLVQYLIECQARVYPNPVIGNALLSLCEPALNSGDVLLSVYTADGREIKGTTLTPWSDGKYLLSLNGLSRGMYFYRVTANGRTIGAGKLVVAQ